MDAQTSVAQRYVIKMSNGQGHVEWYMGLSVRTQALSVDEARTFTSQAALATGIGQRLGLHKTLAAVQGNRTVRKQHMVHNASTPVMEIDAQTYHVRADGVLLSCEPATELPMAQRYFLF